MSNAPFLPSFPSPDYLFTPSEDATTILTPGEVVTLAFGRFTTMDGGVLDSDTGLLWAAADNGRDIRWRDAIRYCRSRGGSWRLPSYSEFTSLFNSGVQPDCGYMDNKSHTCKVDKAIHLSGVAFWSNEHTPPEKPGDWVEVLVVFLHDLNRAFIVEGQYESLRALCVQRP